jgi:hypothetical protein
MSGRQSRFQVFLEGDAYDRETHEPLSSDSDSEAKERAKKKKQAKERRKSTQSKGKSRRESTESESEEDTTLPKQFMMGRFCQRRANVYHKMSHWGRFAHPPAGELMLTWYRGYTVLPNQGALARFTASQE